MLIAENRGRLPASRMCDLLGVSKSSFYYFIKRRHAGKEKLEIAVALIEQIKKLRRQFKGYGYRRMTVALNRLGYGVNHKRVLEAMRSSGLLAKPTRGFKTVGKAVERKLYPNLIRGFVPTNVDQLWIADITFIALRREFGYFAAILDAHSRKVVGWFLKRTMDQELTLAALRMAMAGRKTASGLIHHSDRGAQYTCKEYVRLLSLNGIAISMSRPGNPYDNAKAESFMATLKKEEVNLNSYENLAHAKALIGYFVEDVYNSKRLHSALGYLSPDEFEDKQNASVPLIK